MTATSHDIVLPDRIEVIRGANGHVSLLIDGEALPFAISAADSEPIETRLHRDYTPGVRLTLIAKSVHVRDDYLVGAEVVVGDPHG